MSRFTDAIERECKGLTVSPGAAAVCDECRDSFGCDDDMTTEQAQEYLYSVDEGSFSWSSCDSCGSSLGGDRHAAHGISQERNTDGQYDIFHLSICSDCLLFHANGDEPETWEPRP